MKGGRAAEEDWEAVRQIMGGVIRKPAAASAWDGWEARGRVRNIAEAISGLQDVAWRCIREWKKRTEKERGQYVQREEKERAGEEEERGWRVPQPAPSSSGEAGVAPGSGVRIPNPRP